MSSSVQEITNMEEKIEAELKVIDEKHTMVVDQIRVKSEELAKLKESALIIIGAKSVLLKLTNANTESASS